MPPQGLKPSLLPAWDAKSKAWAYPGARTGKAEFVRLAVVFTLISMAICWPLMAQENDALLRKVDDHYNHLSSFKARYVERYSGMGLVKSESGTLLLKKPGRMRWEYDEPKGKVFVLDGKSAWFYTPGDPQAQKISAKQLDDLRSPLRFLLGHTELQKELVDISIAPSGAGFEIRGVPKGMERRVKSLSLQVDAGGRIGAMKIEEVDGAVTEFAFSQIQEGVPVKDGDFVFTPPPGVTVVDGLPPI